MQKKAPAPPTADTTPYRIADPDEFARNMLRAFEEGNRAISSLLSRPDTKIGPYSTASEYSAATETLTNVARAWMEDPARLADAQTKLIGRYAELWNSSLRRMMGETVAPVAKPEPSDNRFKDPEWSENPYFDFWKQAYLLTTNWAEDMLSSTEGLDAKTRHKADFYMRLMTSAFSPSNFPATNPEILRETFASNAGNFVQGMQQLADDMTRSGDLLKISQTDADAFEVGQNLAITPGKVVFQNDVLQLIQYAPTTDKVREIPLLMIPPWINKFYILDLTPAKSFIKYIVDQGFTVFIVSWVNPDERLASKSYEDYMQEGILAAADAVKRETGAAKCNVLGYCVGGTLLATTLTYLAQRGEDTFNSATFLATQIDFSSAGDLLLFTDQEQLSALDALMTERGYLDGSRMANVFNMMRPRDLIWPYVINNYMLGKKPFPFDLLFWNQDSTRMAAANHKFYLREFYCDNKLARGELSIGGMRLDVSKVTLPVFELAAREDHIAPAKSVFLGSTLFSGPVEFVLAGSGHIAGVVNPPDKVKYQYWTGPHKGKTLDEWMQTAEQHPGSWWPLWMEWLGGYSGELTEARTPGARIGVIEDAPGSYVKAKC